MKVNKNRDCEGRSVTKCGTYGAFFPYIRRFKRYLKVKLVFRDVGLGDVKNSSQKEKSCIYYLLQFYV